MQEGPQMSEAAQLVTAKEFERWHRDDGYRYELVEGRIIRMSPTGFNHGRIVVRMAGLLDAHVRSRKLGTVLADLGCKLKSNPDTVRGPDVAFVRTARTPARTTGF